MKDNNFKKTLNPSNWDKETWIGGALMVVAMIMFYVLIIIFH